MAATCHCCVIFVTVDPRSLWSGLNLWIRWLPVQLLLQLEVLLQARWHDEHSVALPYGAANSPEPIELSSHPALLAIAGHVSTGVDSNCCILG